MFPRTQWKLVERAAKPAGPEQREALGVLLALYRPVLERYLMSWARCTPDVADEIVQQFTCDKMLCGSLLSKADRRKGQFRQLLAVAISRFYIGKLRSVRHEQAMQVEAVEMRRSIVQSEESTQSLIDRAWVREVIDLTAKRMQIFCRSTGRYDIWRIFETEIFLPTLTGDQRHSMTDLAAALNLDSASKVSNLLVTARRIFRRQLVEVLKLMGESEDDGLATLFVAAGAPPVALCADEQSS